MKRPCTPHRLLLVLCSLIAFGYYISPTSVLGYHFFYKQSGGSQLAARWTAVPVNFVVDNTPASFQANVQTATAAWNSVTTARNVFGTLSASGVDFTGSNFNTAWGNMPAGGDGQHEVVFDADGSALAELGLNPAMVNGVAPSRIEIIGGQAVIIDAYFVVTGTRTNFDLLSTMTHELGHVQGIAHSSVGMHNSGSPAGGALDAINVGAVPTMHPFSVGGTARRTLEPDDVAALSELYPEPSFASSTASIEGTVKRCGNEDGVTGANVRAVNTSNANIQLSRFTGFDGNEAGRFSIKGLPPGSYKLIVEPMGANDFNIASRFGTPPTRQEQDFETEYHNPPQEDDCTEELPDTPTNVAVAAGGAATGKNFRVGGARLAFVVDDTGSMGNEISAVRTILAGFVTVLDNLNTTIGTPFPTITIVSFKDDVTRRVTSNNAARLQQVIGSLTAGGGGDCPEAANAALLAAGRLLRNGGVAMLFTDANSRPDGPTRDAVSQLYRSKSLKSFTLLSGTCDGGIPTLTPSSSAPSCEPMCDAGSSNLDEFPPPGTLGNENAVRTFAEIATESGGIFTAIPGIKSGIAVEIQRYINTGTNLAVSSAIPAVGLVSPGDGPQGSTMHLEIRGSNTNFQSTSAVAFSGTGISVNSLVVNSPESITANVTIQPGTALGFRDLTVTTNLGSGSVETATGSGAFNIVTPPTGPTILGISPPQAARGRTLDVAISAANTHFVGGSSVANFGSSVTVNSTTVLSSTSLVANITIPSDAPIGFRDVRVTTGSEVATENMVGPFLVTAPPPPIARVVSVGPAQGARGTTLDILITGENVNFISGGSVASFSGTGITVNSTNVTSSLTAQINITIAPDATLGFRDVFVSTGSEIAAILRAFQVTVLSSVQLEATSLSVNEGTGSIDLIISRAGNTAGDAAVEFGTSDGSATETSDYITVQGVARFAPGETTKRITIPITDDGFVEGNETLNITLINASGTELGSPGAVTLTITDNDTSPATTSPLNDARFFVRQHYHDFLSRVPDQGGLDFWTQQITACNSMPSGEAKEMCFEEKKLNVSTAFFLSIEFQQSGYLVFAFYKASFPDTPSRPRGFARINEFFRDAQEIGRGVVVGQGDWQALLAANKQAFVRRWVERPEFTSLYPPTLSAEQYVGTLFTNSGVVATSAERTAAITAFGSGGVEGRARALLNIAESRSVRNAQFNPSFVLMQYFGFLRRNSNAAPDNDFRGFDFWRTKLDNFSLPGDDIEDQNVALSRIRRAEMLKAFLVSSEYMRRFGPEDFSLRR